ncbi:transporter [Planktothricoides sp. SR001]|uniref:putative sulfate/molybdate transporter n=1 Tax=Planktothricoides sp. SR001 TaxID=1705388 RepID=UPI0006C4AA4C|nr:putative sulfate/molybdate transporter [Planktothricoides sp. SR001]KOR38548.1 transporter [Planktothricoides sp. SR001]
MFGKFGKKVKFNRHEIAGSFGDIGTDLPLIVGMIQAVNLNSASVFIIFGISQMFAGFFYGLPMPMQPLKAMAVLVITQKVPGEILFGAGLAIGIFMLILTLSGGLNLLARLIPLCVVRGLQFGLGLSLASLALKTYIPSAGIPGYIIAALGFLILITTPKYSRIPAGIAVILLGLLYAGLFSLNFQEIGSNIGLAIPEFYQPKWSDILTGFVILALPQIPLSISNSLIATEQTVKDLFPEQRVSIRRIGLTYAIANVIAPFFGGIPVCHGCGGLAGHYALGARTGGSVILYGSMYLIIGLFFSPVFGEVVQVFPQPILGVILLFESLTLLLLIADQAAEKNKFIIALIVGLFALLVPQGYILGMIIGTGLYYLSNRLTFFTQM